MNKFEQGDMDWLERIIDPDRTGFPDFLLSHGRAERIVNHIKELEGRCTANDFKAGDKIRIAQVTGDCDVTYYASGDVGVITKDDNDGTFWVDFEPSDTVDETSNNWCVANDEMVLRE